jgi:hypothetical protein
MAIKGLNPIPEGEGMRTQGVVQRETLCPGVTKETHYSNDGAYRSFITFDIDTLGETVDHQELRVSTHSRVILSRADFLLLELLFDDVGVYITNLVASHVRGLRKSAKHNAEVKNGD